MTNKAEYNAIDIMKFVCAILIVAIHVAPFGYANTVRSNLLNSIFMDWFARIAVPLFFVASGFFLYRKTTPDNFSFEATKAYVSRLMRLYLIWSVIYFPLKVPGILADPKGKKHGILMYLKDVVFVGSYDQLWFLPALITAVLLVSFLMYRGMKLRNIIIIASILYAVGLLAQSWFGLILPLQTSAPKLWACLKFVQSVISTTRNGLFEGFLFVAMGAHFAHNGFKLSKLKAFIGVVISYILMFVEAMGVKHYGFARARDMYIFLVPLTFFAFGLVLNIRIPSDSGIFKTLRILSALIFYSHLWINLCLDRFSDKVGIVIDKSCLIYLITVILSVGFSLIVYMLSECHRLKWMKILY